MRVIIKVLLLCRCCKSILCDVSSVSENILDENILIRGISLVLYVMNRINNSKQYSQYSKEDNENKSEN